MSRDWVRDIADMHAHYGVNEVVRTFDGERLAKLLDFRVKFLKEELDELRDNSGESGNFVPEEVVDALIDLCVVAIGTLDMFDVNPYLAWDAVLDANMTKEVGIKPGRPNPLGLPDLIKPEGWEAPSHEGNHGALVKIEN